MKFSCERDYLFEFIMEEVRQEQEMLKKKLEKNGF